MLLISTAVELDLRVPSILCQSVGLEDLVTPAVISASLSIHHGFVWVIDNYASLAMLNLHVECIIGKFLNDRV